MGWQLGALHEGAVREVCPGLLDRVLALAVLPEVDDLSQPVEQHDIVPAWERVGRRLR